MKSSFARAGIFRNTPPKKYQSNDSKDEILNRHARAGHPYGVSENIIAVFDIGGDMDKYLKASMSASSPYTDSRTDFVMEH